MPALRRREALQAPSQAEALFLIDAVTPRTAEARPRASLSDQVMWVLDLFERIEQRRAGRQLEGGV